MTRYIDYILTAFVSLATIVSCTTPATRQRMAGLLEKAETMNSDYTPMDTIEFMEEVHDFYMRHGNRDERVRANYMMGCVFRDRGDSPMALEYMLNAVNVADTTDNDCDFKRLSRIYGQMAELFHSQRYPQKELEMWEKAILTASQAKDSFFIACCWSKLAGALFIMGDKETAMNIAQKSYDCFNVLGKSDYASALLSHQISYYLNKNLLDSAKNHIDQFISSSNLVDKNGRIEKGHEFFYYYIGLYFEKTDQLDSSLFYYRKLLHYPEDIINLENGFKGMASVYCKLNQIDSANKYIRLYADANDTANIQNSANEISRAQMLYDYSQHQRIAVEKSNEATTLWIVLFITTIVILFASSIIYIKLRKHREISEKIKDDYLQILYKFNVANKELKQLQSNKSSFIEAKTAEVEKLKTILSAYQENMNTDVWDSEQQMQNHKIVSEFKKYASRGGCPTSSEWNDLFGVVDKLLPVFFLKVSEFDLSDAEFKICILSRLHYIPKEICSIVGISKQSVTNIRSSLNKKMFNTEGARSFDKNISKL